MDTISKSWTQSEVENSKQKFSKCLLKHFFPVYILIFRKIKEKENL